MARPQAAEDLSELGDAFCRFITIKLYTAICFCFPLGNASSKDQIIAKLEEALEAISAGFPWLAAQVVIEGGSSKMIGLEKTSRLIV